MCSLLSHIPQTRTVSTSAGCSCCFWERSLDLLRDKNERCSWNESHLRISMPKAHPSPNTYPSPTSIDRPITASAHDIPVDSPIPLVGELGRSAGDRNGLVHSLQNGCWQNNLCCLVCMARGNTLSKSSRSKQGKAHYYSQNDRKADTTCFQHRFLLS